ncbi:hypothetical protein H2201_008988 [Coniosporium apollinis]|uniref:HNH nuclease domain-containing protein n=1 Tax=Coniosporium apollinis TaxID=61459 RepID=A0ABQ9NFL8_9PEZI|nr:hypothetical protein H2201_008988 [Coniosporium apollinis]
MVDCVHIRPAQSIPQHLTDLDTISTDPRHRIRFRHPAYPAGKNVLLTLLAPDHPLGGIHHETARIACAVIAGNRWDGYLSESANGPPLEAAPSAVLRGSDYFFCVPSMDSVDDVGSETYRYPVVPCFSEWRFPHDNLPPSWAKDTHDSQTPTSSFETSNLSVALKVRDGSCRMSAHEEGCQIAHLCPRSEDRWFHANEMHRYIYNVRKPGSGAIDDISNVLLLRSDLHFAFDDLKFVFVPKTTSAAGTCFVVHLLAPSKELRRLYHNTKLHPVTEISLEFLLARFAWSIFPSLESFLQDDVARDLLLASSEGSGETVSAPPEQCKLFTKQAGARSRSASPKKRTRAETSSAAHDDDAELATCPPKRRRTAGDSTSTGVFQSSLSRKDSTSDCSSQGSSAQSSSPPSTVPSEDNSYGEQECGDSEVFAGPDFGTEPSSNEGQDWLTNLRQKYLVDERERSDPDGKWAAEQEWMQQAMARPLSPLSSRRLLEGMGAEPLGFLD